MEGTGRVKGAATGASTAKNKVQVLCVDDEPAVLEGLSLHLARKYDVTTAVSGAAGLEALRAKPGVTVILSDMRMPSMNGAAFLSKTREVAPDAVRMLLTGETDIQSSIAAINEGQIFRFLTKPCAPDRLLAAFEAAVEQHRLVTAERVLLEQTLRGSIQMLSDVLSLTNPLAFGRAARIKSRATELAKAFGLTDVWQIAVAAMLSQLGCVTLSAATVEKLYHGEPLSQDEQAAVSRMPAVAEGLLAHIPRLEDVRASILNQRKHFDGTGQPPGPLRGDKIPVGARVLKIVLDFDELEAQGDAAAVALGTMKSRTGVYDPDLLEAFAKLRGGSARAEEVREIPLRLVSAGMIFAQDVRTSAGALLLARGYEVTEGLVERIRNFTVPGNVRVTVRASKGSRSGSFERS